MKRESTSTIEQPKDKGKERVILEKRAREQINLISTMARENRLHDFYNIMRVKGEKMAVEADAQIFNKRGESKRGVDADAANLWANRVTNKLESFLDRKGKNKSYIKEIELINKAVQEGRINDYYLEQKFAGDQLANEIDAKVFGTGDKRRGKGNDVAGQWADKKVKELEEMIAKSVSEKEIKELLDILDGNKLVDSEVGIETPNKPADVPEVTEANSPGVRVRLVEVGEKGGGTEGGSEKKPTVLGDPKPEDDGDTSAPRVEQNNSEILTKLETEKDPAKRIALWLELAKEQKKKGQGDFEDSLSKAEKELSKIDDINKKINLLISIIDVRISLGANVADTFRLLDEAGKQFDKITDDDLKTVIRRNLIILNGKMTDESAEIERLVRQLQNVQGDIKENSKKDYPMVHVPNPERNYPIVHVKKSESDEIVELSEDELMTPERLADALLDYFWDYMKENPEAGSVPLKDFVDTNKLGAEDIQEIIDNLKKRGFPVQGGYPIQMGDPTMGKINIGEPVFNRIISAENEEAKKIGDNETRAYRLLALATNRILVAKGRPSESLDSGVRFALDQAWQAVQTLNEDAKNSDLVDRLREEIALYWQEYGDSGKYLEVMNWDSGRTKTTDGFEAPSLPEDTIDLLDESGYERLVQVYHEAYPDEDEGVLKDFVRAQLDKGVTTIKASDLKHLKELVDIYEYEYGINLKTDAYRGLISAFNENFPDATPTELVTVERVLEALPDDPKQLEAARSTFLSVLEAKRGKGIQDFEQFTEDLSAVFPELTALGKKLYEAIQYKKILDRDKKVQTMLDGIKTWSIDKLEAELAKYGNAVVINSPERNALSIEEYSRLSFIEDELRRKSNEEGIERLRAGLSVEDHTSDEFDDDTEQNPIIEDTIDLLDESGYERLVQVYHEAYPDEDEGVLKDFVRAQLDKGVTTIKASDLKHLKELVDIYEYEYGINLKTDAYRGLISAFNENFPDATPTELVTVERVLEALPDDPKQLEAARSTFLSVLEAKRGKGIQDFEQFTEDLSAVFPELTALGKKLYEAIQYKKILDRDKKVQTMLDGIKTWSIDKLEAELAKYGNAVVINSPERNALSIEEYSRLSFIEDELRRKSNEEGIERLRAGLSVEDHTSDEFDDDTEQNPIIEDTIDLLDESGYERLVQVYHEAYPDEDEGVLKDFVRAQLDKGVTTIKASDLKHLKELVDIYEYEYGINLKTDAYRGLISAFNENFPDATPTELVTVERVLEALPDDPKQLEAARSTFLSVLEAKRGKGIQDFEQFTEDLSAVFPELTALGKKLYEAIQYKKILDRDKKVQTMLDGIKTWSIDKLEAELAKYGNAVVINSPERNALSIEERIRLSCIQDELKKKTDEASTNSLRVEETERQQEFADMSTDKLVSEMIRYGKIGGFDPFNIRKMSAISLNNEDRPRFDYIRQELLKRPADEVAKAKFENADGFESNLDEDAYHELIQSFRDTFPDATPTELVTVERVLEALPDDPKQLEAARSTFLSVLEAKGDKDGQAEEKNRLLKELEDSIKGTGSKSDELINVKLMRLQQRRFDEFTKDLSKAFAELGNIDFKVKPSAIPDISNAYHELAGLEFDANELSALQSDLDTRGIDYSSLLNEDTKELDSDKVRDAITLAAGLGVGVSVERLQDVPVAIKKGWIAKGIDFILGRNKKNKPPKTELKTGAQGDLDIGFEEDVATESTEPGRTTPFALPEDGEPQPIEKSKKGLATDEDEAEVDGKIATRMSNQEKEAGNAKDPEKRTQAFLKLANVRVADYEAGRDTINLVGARSVLNKAELAARQVKNPKIRKGLIDDIVVYWQRLGDNDTAGRVRAGK